MDVHPGHLRLLRREGPRPTRRDTGYPVCMNRGGSEVPGQARQEPDATKPATGWFRRKFKRLGGFCLRIRERIGRWTDALLALIAASALAIGSIYPYRGVIIAVIGVTFVIVIVVASAMLTVQADQNREKIAKLKTDLRTVRSQAEDAEARLRGVESGRGIDGRIAEQLHRVHHHLRFCSWSLTEGGGEDFGERIKWVVNHIAQLFTEMIDEPCRACIKEIVPSKALGTSGTSGSTVPIDTVVYRTLQRTEKVHPPKTDREPKPLVKSYCFRELWLHSSTTKWILVKDIEREYEENHDFCITS